MMNWRQLLKRSLAFLGLILWMALLFSVGSTYLGPQMAHALSPAEASFAGLALLLVCTVDTLLLSIFILNARFSGWRLMLITALLYYGIKTFQASIEAAYFMVNLTPDLVPSLFLMTLPTTLCWPPLAVWLLGKASPHAAQAAGASPLPPLSVGTWIGKIVGLGVVLYPLLFFAFGYYVAWQNPAVRAFYQGTDPGSFLAQMAHLLSTDPLVLPFEFFRGLLWVGMALLFLWSLPQRPWLATLLLALCFALLENDTHLFPNPLMPTVVRQTHFIETASSNFIFGVSAALLLLRRPVSGQAGVTKFERITQEET